MYGENPLSGVQANERSAGSIIVVDDDEFSSDLMCRRLRRAGYTVSAACDGAAALRMIREQAFDLVLLDVVMPGMDGREVLYAIRDDEPGADLPVIMVTAKSDGSEIADCLGHGANDYVTKPYEFQALIARIETQLARYRAEQALKRSQDELERRVEQRTAELMQANKELEDARNILTDALEAVNDGFVLWDADDRLVTCNQRYREFFGKNAAAIRPGDRFEDLVRRQAEEGYLRSAVGRPAEWFEDRLARHRNPSGIFVEEFSDGGWARMSETRASNGRIVGLCTDITDIKRREIALRTYADTNRRLAAAVNATSSAILITDPNRSGNPTVFANPAFAVMTGWPIEEALGRDRKFLTGTETDAAELGRFEKTILAGNTAGAELRLRSRDGSYFCAEVNASPIRDGDGRIVNWVIIQTNISARRQAEEQLHQSQKMEMVGQLTGGLAHDFNNLLTIVLGNLESALAGGEGADAETRSLLNSALDASRRGAELTRRMLAFARQQTLAPRSTDLRETLTGFENFIGRSLGSGYELRIQGAADLWRVLVDPGQIENAILNLAVNARDAMPDGGAVTVEAANASLKGAADINGQSIADGDYVKVLVADSGLGMAPDIIETAIQPFFTTKESGKGTGLGLSMVYGFVSQSGGAMQIESEPGRGTQIVMYFPRAASDVAVAAAIGRAQIMGGTEKLLIVDDEPEVRAVAAMQLKKLGYQVLQAGDAYEALDILDADGPVDLLVTDIGLPGGINGVDLAAEVRDRVPGMHILFLSGYSEGAAASEAENDPTAIFLAKPYERAALAGAVREAIDIVPVNTALAKSVG